MPSASESFGLVALEAMASGVPVVASHAGGLPEVVPDGEAGYLLPPGDVEAMAERVVQLLSDDGRHARFAAAGRRRAVQFGCDEVVPRFEALYERVLRQPPAPPVMNPDAAAYAGAPG